MYQLLSTFTTRTSKVNKMTKYAIIRDRDSEFYPDPIYTDKQKALKKINYLEDYNKTHNMPYVDYRLEHLTQERESQHNKEWTKWISMID